VGFRNSSFEIRVEGSGLRTYGLGSESRVKCIGFTV
jgi:hypothetical protein